MMYRPYAPPANFVDILRRFKSRQLPETIDGKYLKVWGASQATVSRLLGALRFLGLIELDGTPTDQVRSLGHVDDDEYRNRLSQIVRRSYRDIFASVDPEQDTQATIQNAFEGFEPLSQHYRMAIFFLGLCREAGIPLMEEPRQRRTGIARTARNSREAETYAFGTRGRRGPSDQSDLPIALSNPLIKGLLDLLPEPGAAWDAQKKLTWLETMRLNLDQVYPDSD
jgi:hypothetical protein